jgi:hypothetical protein
MRALLDGDGHGGPLTSLLPSMRTPSRCLSRWRGAIWGASRGLAMNDCCQAVPHWRQPVDDRRRQREAKRQEGRLPNRVHGHRNVPVVAINATPFPSRTVIGARYRAATMPCSLPNLGLYRFHRIRLWWARISAIPVLRRFLLRASGASAVVESQAPSGLALVIGQSASRVLGFLARRHWLAWFCSRQMWSGGTVAGR